MLTKTADRRKRLKRFFEKDEEPIHVCGNTLGRSEDGGVDPKAPQTPRPKATKPVTRSDGEATHANGKKRSSAEVDAGDDEHGSNEGKRSRFQARTSS